MVELALVMPFLLLLLGGAVQVGDIAYTQVTLDSAAREGAQVASTNPATTLGAFFTPEGTTTYTCDNSHGADPNPACTAVAASAGLLDGLGFTVVLTANAPVSSTQSRVVLVASVTQPCNGDEAKVTGTADTTSVPASQTVFIAAGGGGSQPATVVPGGQTSAAYTLCLTSGLTQTVVAQTGAQTCGVYRAQYVGSFPKGQVSVAPGVTLVAVPCPTPTPAPSPTSTPPAVTPVPSPAAGASSGASSCANPYQGTYVTVDVSYEAAVFMPLVNRLLADPGDPRHRRVDARVTMRVQPCGITQGS